MQELKPKNNRRKLCIQVESLLAIQSGFHIPKDQQIVCKNRPTSRRTIEDKARCQSLLQENYCQTQEKLLKSIKVIGKCKS